MGLATKNALQSLKKRWAGTSRGEKIKLAAIAGGFVALCVAIVISMSPAPYTAIFSGSAENAGFIADRLRALGEDVRIQDEGTVLVPEDRLSDVTMSLATSGYSTVSYNTEYLDRAMAPGMSDADKREFMKLQTAEEMRTVLKKWFPAIADCFVILDIPEELPGSASITIEITADTEFTQDNAHKVRDVAAAGTGIEPENIYIVDSTGQEYPYTKYLYSDSD